MQFLVKVRVDLSKMAEFGQKLQRGELDRSCIRGETYCLQSDPAVGYSIWEADSQNEFEAKFSQWRPYYSSTEIEHVISPMQAMKILFEQNLTSK
jgi:hypothetical protein